MGDLLNYISIKQANAKISAHPELVEGCL